MNERTSERANARDGVRAHVLVLVGEVSVVIGCGLHEEAERGEEGRGSAAAEAAQARGALNGDGGPAPDGEVD
jgi:hypothetical protein